MSAPKTASSIIITPTSALMLRACARGKSCGAASPIGYVGYSGNANPAGPHLHMAINRMAPGEKWYQGTPINPYPLLAGKAARR